MEVQHDEAFMNRKDEKSQSSEATTSSSSLSLLSSGSTSSASSSPTSLTSCSAPRKTTVPATVWKYILSFVVGNRVWQQLCSLKSTTTDRAASDPAAPSARPPSLLSKSPIAFHGFKKSILARWNHNHHPESLGEGDVNGFMNANSASASESVSTPTPGALHSHGNIDILLEAANFGVSMPQQQDGVMSNLLDCDDHQSAKRHFTSICSSGTHPQPTAMTMVHSRAFSQLAATRFATPATQPPAMSCRGDIEFQFGATHSDAVDVNHPSDRKRRITSLDSSNVPLFLNSSSITADSPSNGSVSLVSQLESSVQSSKRPRTHRHTSDGTLLTWIEVVTLAAQRLTLLEPDAGGVFTNRALCAYLDKEWDNICRGRKKTNTWRHTVSRELSTNPHIFRSFPKLGPGHWKLTDQS